LLANFQIKSLESPLGKRERRDSPLLEKEGAGEIDLLGLRALKSCGLTSSLGMFRGDAISE